MACIGETGCLAGTGRIWRVLFFGEMGIAMSGITSGLVFVTEQNGQIGFTESLVQGGPLEEGQGRYFIQSKARREA